MKAIRLLPLAALLACGAALPRPLAAQVPVPGLGPGALVRMNSPVAGQGEVVARVEGVTDGSFAYSLDAHPGWVWTQHIDRVERLSIYRGSSRKRSAWRGALRGAFIAGSVGGIVGPFAGRSVDSGPWQLVGTFGGASALVGAGVGALVGAVWSPERWQQYVFTRGE